MYLLVVAEQIAVDLPVHKLIITCEKLEGCKMLRVLNRLACIEVLFSQYDPVFTQDSFISLLPLPFNNELSTRTTRIYMKKSGKGVANVKRFVAGVLHFLQMFGSIFKSPEGFSKNFNLSLTRFLILFGYTLHKLKDKALYKLFVKLLKSFNRFYDLDEVLLSATSLRSTIVFAAIYEFQQNWVSVFRAKLLQNDIDPFTLLHKYLPKVSTEHESAQIIYSCLLYTQKSGISKSQFLKQSLPSPHESLIHYIVSNY